MQFITYSSALLLFARFAGFFLISPLFAQKGIPKIIRLGAAIACTLILVPIQSLSPVAQPFLALHILQEVAIGYLMGFLFTLLFEAAAFAGELVGATMGFSLTELLDPLSTSSHPLMGRFFSLVAFALFFALDLHHPLLHFLYKSFEVTATLHYPFDHSTSQTFMAATSLLFKQALAFASLPLTFLLALVALFAIISRFFPIFWIGFPLQLIIGFFAIASTLYLFIPLVKQSFSQFWTLLQNLVVHF